MHRILVAVIAASIFLIGCATPEPAVDLAAEERAVREADTEWSKAVGARDVEQSITFVADDARMHPPNAPTATGRDAIRKVFEQLVAMPGFSITWQPNKVEVARSGDIAYSAGTYEHTVNDPKGNPTTDRGKYVTVWKKQADGSWKVVEDIFNSDLAPPASAK